MPRVLLLAMLLAAPVGLPAQSPSERAVASITPQDIAARIGVIAHDSMMGRDTPSPGLDMTAEYIAREFRRFGLTPGGDDGTFLQRYPLGFIAADPDRSSIRIAGGPVWRVGEDAAFLFGGYPTEPVTGPAVVVTVSTSGQPAPDRSLQGAIVFVRFPSDGDAVLGSRRGNQVLFAVYRSAPAAVVAISDQDSESWNAVLGQRQLVREGQEPRTGTPILAVREEAARSVLEARGVDLTATNGQRVTPLPGLDVSVALVPKRFEGGSAPNVVGILEGSDPVLKNEYVVFSAHMDHVGAGQPVDGDSIYNGADDDASGTIGVVELAEAFSMLDPRPKRSMIFLAVSGEEKGLWGSDHFVANPPVPVEQMVANLNADMIGRNWPDTIVVIGKEHSDLGATLNRVNAEHNELGMTAIDDIWPEERFYYRSDHFNFARRGVPVLFFFNGTHEDYHRPSDHVERIDAEKESRIVKLMFYLGLEVANAAERPQWDPDSYRQIVQPVGDG